MNEGKHEQVEKFRNQNDGQKTKGLEMTVEKALEQCKEQYNEGAYNACVCMCVCDYR